MTMTRFCLYIYILWVCGDIQDICAPHWLMPFVFCFFQVSDGLVCQIRVYDFLVQYKSISEEDMGILRYSVHCTATKL